MEDFMKEMVAAFVEDHPTNLATAKYKIGDEVRVNHSLCSPDIVRTITGMAEIDEGVIEYSMKGLGFLIWEEEIN